MSMPARWKLPLLAVLGLALICVGRYSIAEGLARVYPEAALLLNGSNETALVRLSQRLLDEENSIARPETSNTRAISALILEGEAEEQRNRRAKIRRLAKHATEVAPLDAVPFRILGEVADLEGNESEAFAMMTAAYGRSKQERTAAQWLMQYSLQHDDPRAAVQLGDVLMRTRSQSAQQVVPSIMEAIKNDGALASLVDLLRKSPPWQDQFYRYMPDGLRDVREPLKLFSALQSADSPASMKDILPYIRSLTQRGYYDVAYYAWIMFSPFGASDIGGIFNGDFNAPLVGGPFDWDLRAGTGTILSTEAKETDASDKFLRVELVEGRVEFRGVSQLLLLPSGRYRINGQYQLNLSGPRGLRWRLRCASSDQPITGESDMLLGAKKDWSNFVFEANVPPVNCQAQTLNLELDARSSSERLVSGMAGFDNMTIMRLSDK